MIPLISSDYTLPPFYYPTQTIFVDDDETFVKIFATEISLMAQLDNYDCFTRASSAVDYVNGYDNSAFFSDLLLSKSKALFDNPRGDFCLERHFIFNLLSKSQRFGEISTAIIDYSMPEMDGITLCKYINKRIKRVILTGKGDQEVAIRAFNSGMISQYINKGDENVSKKIAQVICNFQFDYFKEPCEVINKFLGAKHFLNEKNIVVSFKQLCEQYQIEEYYLIHPTQLLCLSRHGKHFLFIAENYDSLAKHYQIAAERHASKEVLDLLSAATHVPYFPTADGYFNASLMETPFKQYFYEKYGISGKEKHFCAFLEGPTMKNFLPETILSFDSYLNRKRINS